MYVHPALLVVSRWHPSEADHEQRREGHISLVWSWNRRSECHCITRGGAVKRLNLQCIHWLTTCSVQLRLAVHEIQFMYTNMILHFSCKINRPNLGHVLIWVTWHKTVNCWAQKERKALPWPSNYSLFHAGYSDVHDNVLRSFWARQFTVLHQVIQIRTCPKLGWFTLCVWGPLCLC